MSTAFEALGGTAGCKALSAAFYRRVAEEPLLRPLFPSTFRCAIEEFSAFLVQFLGGPTSASQDRWWLSLRESHQRFRIGVDERAAWMRAMSDTLTEDVPAIPGEFREELLRFFAHGSRELVNVGALGREGLGPGGELGKRWDQQTLLEAALAAIKAPQGGSDAVDLLNMAELRSLFTQSPAIHASTIALGAASNKPDVREYAFMVLRANPTLVNERYSHSRTLLHDACATGDLALVELVLDLGGGRDKDGLGARSPLYCLANESSGGHDAEIVHVLVTRTGAEVDAMHGAKRCAALHMAARRGNTAVIAALLDCGANIEARDSAGDTAFRRAVNCNKVDAARLLLARGADRWSVGSKRLTVEAAARTPEMKSLFV